jgi:hypothetical protein
LEHGHVLFERLLLNFPSLRGSQVRLPLRSRRRSDLGLGATLRFGELVSRFSGRCTLAPVLRSSCSGSICSVEELSLCIGAATNRAQTAF